MNNKKKSFYELYRFIYSLYHQFSFYIYNPSYGLFAALPLQLQTHMFAIYFFTIFNNKDEGSLQIIKKMVLITPSYARFIKLHPLFFTFIFLTYLRPCLALSEVIGYIDTLCSLLSRLMHVAKFSCFSKAVGLVLFVVYRTVPKQKSYFQVKNIINAQINQLFAINLCYLFIFLLSSYGLFSYFFIESILPHKQAKQKLRVCQLSFRQNQLNLIVQSQFWIWMMKMIIDVKLQHENNNNQYEHKSGSGSILLIDNNSMQFFRQM